MAFFVFLFAFLSFIYELAIAQTMALLTADALVWYALGCGILLGSMGLGALWSGSAGMCRSPVRTLVFLNCLQALIGGTVIILLYVMQTVTMVLGGHNPVFASGAFFFAVAFLATVTVGLLAGAALPVLTEMGQGGRLSLARITVVYYFGLFLAGAIFPFLLLPHLSTIQIALGAGLISALVALSLSWNLRDDSDLRPAVLSTALVMILGILLWQAPVVEMSFAEKYYSPVRSGSSWKDLFVSSGPQASLRRYHSARHVIDRVQFPPGGEEELKQLIQAYHLPQAPYLEELSGWGLFVDGAPRFSADFEDVYHETFAHVPVAALAATPEHVLILGGGDGLLARELLKYPSVKDIVVVDADGGMIRLFRDDPVLKGLNHSSLGDPRVRIVNADAYDFIRRDRKSYDAIYLDFPHPVDYDGSKEFSYEFLRFVKAHLAPAGFMAMAMPGFLQGEGSHRLGDSGMSSDPLFLATIRAVGFETIVPFFSRLEEDNPAALAVMRNLSGGEKNLDKDMLRDYVGNLTSGFLLTIPRRGVVLQKDFSLPVSLNILNADRFRLSLETGESLNQGADGVNTIFHPVLPRPGIWWKIRSPY